MSEERKNSVPNGEGKNGMGIEVRNSMQNSMQTSIRNRAAGESGREELESGAKKEYLRQYLPKVLAVKDLELEIERIRLEKMYPSGPVLDGLPRGQEHWDLSDYVAVLESVYEKLLHARYEKIMCYESIYQKIEEMEDETEKRVLRLKYIRGMSWERVSEEMEYSVRAIHKIHNKALLHFKVENRECLRESNADSREENAGRTCLSGEEPDKRGRSKKCS